MVLNIVRLMKTSKCSKIFYDNFMEKICNLHADSVGTLPSFDANSKKGKGNFNLSHEPRIV